MRMCAHTAAATCACTRARSIIKRHSSLCPTAGLPAAYHIRSSIESSSCGGTGAGASSSGSMHVRVVHVWASLLLTYLQYYLTYLQCPSIMAQIIRAVLIRNII